MVQNKKNRMWRQMSGSREEAVNMATYKCEIKLTETF